MPSAHGIHDWLRSGNLSAEVCAGLDNPYSNADEREPIAYLDGIPAFTDELARAGETFDVVFIDPPYRMENTGEMCAALYDKGLLSDHFLIVVEHRRGMAPLLDARFAASDLRRYGDTEITFVRRAKAPGEEDAHA